MPLPPTSDTYINIKDVGATDIIEITLYSSHPLEYEQYKKGRFRWAIMDQPPNSAKAGYITKLTGSVSQNDLTNKAIHVVGSPMSIYGWSGTPLMDGHWGGPHLPAVPAEIPWNYIKESWVLKDFVVSIGSPPTERARTKKLKVIFR